MSPKRGLSVAALPVSMDTTSYGNLSPTIDKIYAPGRVSEDQLRYYHQGLVSWMLKNETGVTNCRKTIKRLRLFAC